MSERAGQVMRNIHVEQRAAERRPVCVSAMVSCTEPHCQDKIGLIRDMSDSGIFFYSNIAPEMGSDVILTFNIPSSDRQSFTAPAGGGVVCRGTVVRLVKTAAGAATGVAIELEEREMLYQDAS